MSVSLPKRTHPLGHGNNEQEVPRCHPHMGLRRCKGRSLTASCVLVALGAGGELLRCKSPIFSILGSSCQACPDAGLTVDTEHRHGSGWGGRLGVEGSRLASKRLLSTCQTQGSHHLPTVLSLESSLRLRCRAGRRLRELCLGFTTWTDGCHRICQCGKSPPRPLLSENTTHVSSNPPLVCRSVSRCGMYPWMCLGS
jgi:hypothetical protein